jgi:anti-repressor protein
MTEEKNMVNEGLNTLVFNNDEFGNIRTVILNNNPWFVGKDVAECLGYTNSKKAIRDHVDDEDKIMGERNVTPSITDKLGRVQYPVFINESGLYALIFGSKLDKAKEFKHWVTSEVLPQIRKTGGYIPIEKDDDDLTIMAKALNIMQNTLEQKDELLAQKEEVISKQKPLVDFANTVSATPTMVDMKTMAKLLEKENQDIHMGRNKLFAWLRKEGYLMSDNTPYERYVKQGIFKLTESEVETKNGNKLITKTYVTGKWQLYLAKKLAQYFASQSASA